MTATEKFAIETADFRATEWKPTRHNGEAYEICTCYELIGGKWEGFVSMRRVK